MSLSCDRFLPITLSSSAFHEKQVAEAAPISVSITLSCCIFETALAESFFHLLLDESLDTRDDILTCISALLDSQSTHFSSLISGSIRYIGRPPLAFCACVTSRIGSGSGICGPSISNSLSSFNNFPN